MEIYEAVSGHRFVPIYPKDSISRVGLPTGYRADVQKIIQLLIGDSLYDKKEVCIREIVQNAFDACIRRQDNSLLYTPSIILSSNPEEGSFNVEDNGEGMTSHLLANSFAIVGKSITHEQNIFERLASQEDKLYLIAKFGIGFISSYIIADRISISTQFSGHDAIHFTITDIAKPFEYHGASQCGRSDGNIGTTVGIVLKPAFRITGAQPIDIVAVARHYCRHVPHFKIIDRGDTQSPGDDWNTNPKGSPFSSFARRSYELRVSFSGAPRSSMSGPGSFIASNGGIFITDNPMEITPDFMPSSIAGEVNLFPGAVDLNIARNQIMDNAKAWKIANQIAVNLQLAMRNEYRSLIGEVEARRDKGELVEPTRRTDFGRRLLDFQDLLMLSLLKASTNTEVRLKPLVDEVEAAEMLFDLWLVSVSGGVLSLREAVSSEPFQNNNSLYVVKSRGGKLTDHQKIFMADRKARGFVVRECEEREVYCKGRQRHAIREEEVLEKLAKRNGFQIQDLSVPSDDDVRKFAVPKERVPDDVRGVISFIERVLSIDLLPVEVDADYTWLQLNRSICVNLHAPRFRALVRRFKLDEEAVLSAYIKGTFSRPL